MKNIVRLVFVFAVFILLQPQFAQANVIDETKTKSAQFAYSEYYTAIKEYKGISGVTFISYSTSWNTIDKLKALETELLKNKNGAELALLEKVEIYPDYPAGKDTLGQYYAEYNYNTTTVDLLPGRVIQLYGGNDYRTVESIATTLSHEYGHHFTFYHLIEGENMLPDNWLQSEYAKTRELTNGKAHVDGSGEYIWLFHEIVAEDYVQLFGSDNAIKNYTQMNAMIDTPFDRPSIQQYWSEQLSSNQYKPKSSIPMYLLNYEKNTQDQAYYDLQLYIDELQNKKSYLIGQEGTGTYYPVQLAILNGEKTEQWYRQNELGGDRGWILDSYTNSSVNLRVIQHEEVGFNRGSKTLKLTYSSIENSKVDQQILNKANELSLAEKKKLLLETAIKYGIPPEILKAIAFIETNMKQFDAGGNPIITDDGGIGMMQVTLTDEEMSAKGIDRNKLETNTQYNIEIGAQILKEKWGMVNNGRIPKINDHDPTVVENWYFAVMAYNGLSKRNDPNVNLENTAYQERVFSAIRDYSQLDIKEIPDFEVEYSDPNAPEIMYFPTKEYKWPDLNTKSTQMLKVGDLVYSYNTDLSYSNVRDNVDGIVKGKVSHYMPFEIVAGPYDPTANESNHYVMYKVRGNNIEGYISSSVIKPGDIKLFRDITRAEVDSAVTYLGLRNVINGYEDGTFKPNQNLLRRHAAALIVNELGLTLPEGYEVKPKDMQPGELGYEEMMIVEAHGIMGQGSDYRPAESLTREQMASILARAYKSIYEKPTSNKTFTDIDESYWNYEEINMLYFNGITVVDAFRPNDKVTRAHFALFLQRTIELKESK